MRGEVRGRRDGGGRETTHAQEGGREMAEQRIYKVEMVWLV